MKEIKALAFRIRISEYVHLALMALLYAIPVALAFDEDDPAYRFAWALGTVIPVLIIRFLCQRTEKKRLRLLLSLAVIGLTMLVTGHHYHWTYYLLTALPVALLGSLFAKSFLTDVITVPSVFSLFFIFPVYGLGKMLESRQINMHTEITLALTALLVVNYLIYASQSGLLSELRTSAGTEISASGMIRQNRRTILLFLLIGASILTVIAFLMSRKESETTQKIIQVEVTETVAATDATEAPLLPMGHSEDSQAFHLGFLEHGYLIFLVFGAIGAFALAFFLLRFLFASQKQKRKDLLPEPREGLTIERLEIEKAKREREKLSGWEKKIRRGYEKLILGRSRQNARLRFMTPSELEDAARLSSHPETRTLHEIYEQTRYGMVPPTREDYARFKDCTKMLEKESEKKRD